MKNTLTAALAIAAISATACVAEEKFSVKPGKWKTTSTITLPMTPQPQVNVEETCISEEDAAFDFDRMMGDEASCELLSSTETKTSVDFTMSCDMGGMIMTGEGAWRASDNGSTMNGDMAISGNIPGLDMAMTLNASFEGKRLGDCDA